MENFEVILKYIDKNIEGELGANEIATLVNYSSSHLQRIFKSTTGTSVMSYIKSKKLIYSRGLLVNSDKRVCDIALELGFDYEQSYIRAFKKQYGITPKQYRLKEKND